MTTRLFLTILLLATPVSAHALTMKECGEKYRAAQKAGTLGGLSWNAFRMQSCAASDASGQPASAANAAPSPDTSSAAPAAAPVAAPNVSGTDPIFPTAISPSFSEQSSSKARRMTCLEQYRANKKAGGNGGLKWIQKGGGYYSLCSKHLRG
jgi:hypothetical protein